MSDAPLAAPRPRLRRPSPVGSRLTPLEALAEIVADGARVGIGGTWLSSRPMAAVRQLVRAGRRDLHVVALNGTLDVDLLVGAGCATKVSFCFVSLGPFGLAPQFRAAIEDGTIEADEHTGHGLTVALEAASRGLEAMPFFGPVGSVLADRYPMETGSVAHAAAALPLGVALLHAEAATADGHVLLPATVGTDVITARAADCVVVTAERIVDRLPLSGARYLAPAEVDHVIEVPLGAHPLAQCPDYGMDWRVLLDYADAAATADGFRRWIDTDIAGTEAERRTRIDADRLAGLRATGIGRGRVPPPSGSTAEPVGPHERIVIELSRRIHDGDAAILGSVTPIGYAAALLAQQTHAPSLDFIAYGFSGTDIGWLGFLGVEGRAQATGYGPIRIEELVGALRFRGLIAFEPVRPVQVDGRGAMNLRWLRTGDGRRIRLPGVAGAPEVVEMHRRPLGYLTEHSTRTCVAEVDDVSVRIHLPHAQREPFTLVTDLAVLEFGAGGWSVVSRHPGVTAAALEAATGFPLLGAASAPLTTEPAPDLLAVLRTEIDPLGIAATEMLGGRDRRRMLATVLDAEERILREGG